MVLSSVRERALKHELLQDDLVPLGEPDLKLEVLKSPDGPSC